jgi:hypothetical protein
VVDYFGRAMLPLSEAISIGILEATVHLLDLQRALGVPPEVPPAGLEHTVGAAGRDDAAGGLHRACDRPK